MTKNLKILIVDDEINIRKTLGLALETEGHSVISVENIDNALLENSRAGFDICFLDMRLGIENGLTLLQKLLLASPWLKIIVITAHASIDNAVEAMRLGAFDYIEKPFALAQVFAATRKVETVQRLEEKIRALEAEVARNRPDLDLRSDSLAMRKVLDLARGAAPTEATILITGENGTGKTILANAIHAWSRRSAKPFAVVSCPSLSSDLLESELFGHSKGAFTGAFKSNPGRIESCEGGTLFLDEIGDMPLPLQAKLLRFLQDHRYEKVGDNVTRQANVRVIAATNVKLKEAVQEGRFREDLYYRLNVVPILMPPLRERVEDIETLARQYLAALRPEKRILGFSESALSALRAYDWPGNIRELQNVIERAVILAKGEWLEAHDFNIEERIVKAFSSLEEASTLLTLEQIEEGYIRRILATSLSMEQAAAILGIDTVTLWRKRKRYGL